MSQTLAEGSTLVSRNWNREGMFRPVVPPLCFKPGRWATLRSENVDQMAKAWSDEPSLVVVLSDPKLDSNELVVLSKETLDKLLTPLKELTAGRAALRVDVQVIESNVLALKCVLKMLLNTLGPEQDSPARNALAAAFANIDALEIYISKVSASIVLPNPLETPHSIINEEETRLAKELQKEEDS
jgi:hypothetical protein